MKIKDVILIIYFVKMIAPNKHISNQIKGLLLYSLWGTLPNNKSQNIRLNYHVRLHQELTAHSFNNIAPCCMHRHNELCFAHYKPYKIPYF
jgi:hypothetical protein